MPLAADALPTLSVADAESIVRERVHAVTRVGFGSRAGVYRVETDEGLVRIVRLSSRVSGRADREAWVRARLKKHPDVPLVPEVRIQSVPLARSVDVVSMSELPGVTLAAAERSLFEHELCALWRRAGECLGAVHETPVERFGLLDGAGRGVFSSWPEAFSSLYEGALTEARIAGLTDLLDEARASLESCARSLDPQGPAQLVHGDPQPGNVQVHRGAIVALLDWEFAQGADPDYELASIETHFEHGAPDRAHASESELASRRAAFFEGYRSRRPRWSPAPSERTRAYRLLHALRGSELLSVYSVRLSPPDRARIDAGTRAQIARFLPDRSQ